MKRVISLGSVNLDLQVKVSRWPQPGEALPAHELLITGGGKAANVAFQVHRLGGEVALVAHVGDDSFADQALERLSREGVNLSYIKRVENVATGLAMIAVRPDGEKSIILSTNANEEWEREDFRALDRVFEDSSDDSILTVDLEMAPDAVEYALERANYKGLTVVLDPSPADRMRDSWYSRVDYIVPNVSEASMLSGVQVESLESAFMAAEVIFRKGAGAALVKFGKEGCAMVSSQGQKQYPTIQVAAIDKTGAGDAFAGGLSYGLLQSWNFDRVIRTALVTSALSVTAYGSQDSYAGLQDVNKYL